MLRVNQWMVLSGGVEGEPVLYCLRNDMSRFLWWQDALCLNGNCDSEHFFLDVEAQLCFEHDRNLVLLAALILVRRDSLPQQEESYHAHLLSEPTIQTYDTSQH